MTFATNPLSTRGRARIVLLRVGAFCWQGGKKGVGVLSPSLSDNVP